jgi:hypothetical protein
MSVDFYRELKEMNAVLLEVSGVDEKKIDEGFFLWRERKQPFTHFSLHEGKFSCNDTIWEDELLQQ